MIKKDKNIFLLLHRTIKITITLQVGYIRKTAIKKLTLNYNEANKNVAYKTYFYYILYKVV